MASTVRLVGPTQRDYACKLVREAPDGYVVRIGEETRRDAQNKLLHALLTDIKRQIPEMAAFSIEDMKAIFMHNFGAEIRFLPELEGAGLFPVGTKTSTLSVSQFSGLVETIHAWAAGKGVVFVEHNRA